MNTAKQLYINPSGKSGIADKEVKQMLTVGEWVDATHEIANSMEHQSSVKLNRTIAEANARHEGYVQACEDFAKAMRQKISEEQG